MHQIFWYTDRKTDFTQVYDLPFIFCFFLLFFFPFLSSLSGHGGEWEHENSHSLCIKLSVAPPLVSPSRRCRRACEFSASFFATCSATELCCQCDVLYFDPIWKQPTHQPQKPFYLYLNWCHSSHLKKKHLKHFSDPLCILVLHDCNANTAKHILLII